MKIALTLLLNAVIPVMLLHAEAPVELIQARESYQKAKDQALAPVERRYLESLIALRKRFTQKGDLEGALAIDAEIKSHQPVPANTTSALAASTLGTVPASSNPFLGEWLFSNAPTEHKCILPDGKTEIWSGRGTRQGQSVWSGFTWKLNGQILEIYDTEGVKRQEWKMLAPDKLSGVSMNKTVPPFEGKRVAETWKTSK